MLGGTQGSFHLWDDFRLLDRCPQEKFTYNRDVDLSITRTLHCLVVSWVIPVVVGPRELCIPNICMSINTSCWLFIIKKYPWNLLTSVRTRMYPILAGKKCNSVTIGEGELMNTKFKGFNIKSTRIFPDFQTVSCRYIPWILLIIH